MSSKADLKKAIGNKLQISTPANENNLEEALDLHIIAINA